MTLTTTTAWDGRIEAIGVEDGDGGVWWPSEETQAEIQAAADPHAKAVQICQEQPTRGQWSC